jgi:tetratricopeptide (TPR) repeat protein
MIPVPRFCFALLLIAAPAWAASAGTASPGIERAVLGFYSAYASGDAAAAASFWTSKGARTFVTRSTRTLRIRCQVLQAVLVGPVVVGGVEVGAVEVDGEAATANVEARLTRWSAMAGAVLETDVQRSVIVLRRQHGAWKIDEWRMQEEDLVRRLLELPTPEERAALLRSAGVLRNVRLVRILCREAVTKINQDHRALGMELVGQAKELAAELDDPSAFSDALGVESILLRSTDLPAGLAAAHTAAALAGESGDPDALARALMRLARAQSAAGTLDAAASSLERVLALGQFIEDASILALSASQLAKIHDDTGHPREALRYALMASAHAAETGDPASIISAEMNLAGTYCARGDMEMAIPHVEKVLDAAERAGFVATYADALDTLARDRLQMGDGERYLELSSKALALLEQNGGPDPRAEVLAARTNILVSRAMYRMHAKDYSGSEEELDRACKLLQQSPHETAEHRDLDLTMGWLRASQHRYSEAMRYAERLDPIASDLLASALDGLGRGEEARKAWEAAVRETEEYRIELDHGEHRSLFLQVHALRYIGLIANLVVAGEPRQALAVAERL